MDMFKEIIPSLYYKKDISTIDDSYIPFIINRAGSYHIDIVLYANEMNLLPHLDKQMQYDYLLHSIRPKKRPFVPWIKKIKNEDINLIMDYYDISYKKALDVLGILESDEVKYIKEKSDIGGIKKS